MKAQCLPFSQIPHTAKLFTDFLSWSPGVRAFYPRPPHFSEWLKDETANVRYDDARRGQVADALERQNRKWGASQKTMENIAKLRTGAYAAVTGQQVGLFGGPAFSLYKALTAIKLANQASAAGVECVPIFWLATEDHDLEEVDQVNFPGAEGPLQKLTASVQGAEHAPVGSLVLGDGIAEVVAKAAESAPETELATLLGKHYAPGKNFGDAFAGLFAQLFGDWGVILLDASDPLLHEMAAPIYRAAAERSAELDAALLDRGRALESAGFHQQVKVTPSSTLLFALRNGARVPVHRQASGEFTIGDEKLPQAQLLREIEDLPQNFSANVLLRPVIQDYLLPTLAYTGGAAEVAYFAQAAVVYQTLLGRVTPIIPRFSATIVSEKAQSLLDRYGLKFGDVPRNPEQLWEVLAVRALPQELKSAFEEAKSALAQSLEKIRGPLEKLDKTLVEAASNASAKMQHQLESLQAKAARAESRQQQVIERKARMLSSWLYPNKNLQEREIAGMYLLAIHGRDLLQKLYEFIHTDCLDHQVIFAGQSA